MQDDAPTGTARICQTKLWIMLLALVAGVILFLLIKPYLGPAWQRPGQP